MAYTKYIGYGGTATLLLLIAWFVGSAHFLVEYEGDKTCDGTYSDPCEWKYNITLITIQTYYIQNQNLIELVFLPGVKGVYNCKKDGRMTASWRANRELAPCGIGYREFGWKTPLTSRYKYINKFYKNKKQEFKIVVFKFNPEDDIKFGGEITKDEFDPYFYGNWNISKLCQWKTETQDVYGNVTYEYTCLTNTFSFNASIKKAYCKNDFLNVNGTNSVIYEHYYDYGYVANKTIYWRINEKTGTKDVTICDKWEGVKINNKILNWTKHNFQCSRPEQKTFECDRCGDDGNCDGILDTGESGCRFELKSGKITKSCRGDNPPIEKLIRKFNVK